MPVLPEFPVYGGCVCSAVRYGLTNPPKAVYACHCRDCQRLASGPYAIGIIVDKPGFHIGNEACVQRTDRMAESGNIVPQFGCADCMTRLWHQPPKSPSMLILRAGTLDDPSWARPVAHTWTRSRLPWIDIGNELQFETALPSRDVLYAAWKDFADKGATS